MTRLAVSLAMAIAAVAPAVAAGKKSALLVGVERYTGTGLSNLKYAEKDVTDLKAALEALGYKVTLVSKAEYRVTERDDRDPTADNIRAHLDALTRTANAEDTVLVALSGHGVHLKATDKLYYCPARADLGNPATLVALDDVMAALAPFDPATDKGCKAGSKVVLVDACRNDPTDGRATGDGRMQSLTRPLVPEPAGGTVALFSCSKGQISHESDTFRHGFLMHYVIEGLGGKAASKRTGVVSWDSLVAYVKDEVPAAVVEQKGPRANQFPESRGRANVLELGRVLAHMTWPARDVATAMYAVHYGIGKPIDHTECLKLARRGAAAGNPLCRLSLAFYLRDGTFAMRDLEEAARLESQALEEVRAAADTGDAVAQCELGGTYLNGYGVPRDGKEGAKWLRQSAEQGYAPAQGQLGQLHMEGVGVPADVAEALPWLRKAAGQADPNAQNLLGVLHFDGRGVAEDRAEAARLFHQAARLNSGIGQSNLAYCHLNGTGIPQDDPQALRWFRAAGEQGVADAANMAGVLTADGRGTEKNRADAVRWYRKAADRGLAVGQTNLADALYEGTGVTQDYAEALKWYRAAAAQDSADGQFGVGKCYEFGRSVAEDAAEAVKWYRKAAAQKHAFAQFRLGVCFGDGKGVAKDPAEAIEWFRLAAAQDVGPACYELGWRYTNGRGVPADAAEGMKWFRKGAALGDEDCKGRLDPSGG